MQPQDPTKIDPSQSRRRRRTRKRLADLARIIRLYNPLDRHVQARDTYERSRQNRPHRHGTLDPVALPRSRPGPQSRDLPLASQVETIVQEEEAGNTVGEPAGEETGA